MHLCPAAAHPRVEPDRPQCRRTVSAIGPFKDIHFPRRAGSQMVVPDDAPEPLHFSNHQTGVMQIGVMQIGVMSRAIRLMHPVPPADTADHWVGGKMRLDALQPVRVGRRVVIRQGDDVPGSRFQSRVHGCDDPWCTHANSAERQGRLAAGKKILRLLVAVAHHHPNVIRRPRLRFQGRETPAQVLGAAVGRDKHGQHRSGAVRAKETAENSCSYDKVKGLLRLEDVRMTMILSKSPACFRVAPLDLMLRC